MKRSEEQRIELIAEHRPDTEQMLRGLMLVLGLEPAEIERVVQKRRQRDDSEGRAA